MKKDGIDLDAMVWEREEMSKLKRGKKCSLCNGKKKTRMLNIDNVSQPVCEDCEEDLRKHCGG